MSKENWILFAGLVLAATAPLAPGLLLHWPVWTTVGLCVVVIAASYLRLGRVRKNATYYVGALLEEIGLRQGDPLRDLTARRFAKLIEAAGSPAIAQEVRRRFDSPHHSFVASGRAPRGLVTARPAED